MPTIQITNLDGTLADIDLKILKPSNIKLIETALKRVGPFGKIHWSSKKVTCRFCEH